MIAPSDAMMNSTPMIPKMHEPGWAVPERRKYEKNCAALLGSPAIVPVDR